MIVTERDNQVILFIEKFKIATTSTISGLFYPSLRVAQHRLKLLYENKLLKRDRDPFTGQYYYYNKKPIQIRHSLLLTNFYREINKLVDVKLFENEFTHFEGIRPDGFLAVEFSNKKKEIYFVETEISNKPDIEKYEELYKSNQWKSVFPKFPKLIFVTDKTVGESKLFDVIKIGENLKDIKL